MRKVVIINGPNLNLLGTREPEVYGAQTLGDLEARCVQVAQELAMDLTCRQSNWEGQIIDWIQEAHQAGAGIVINPAALTHTSVAVLDALSAGTGPVVEVHISNVHKREAFRHHSYVSRRADAVIVGCGLDGYEWALRQMDRLLRRA